MSRKNTIPNKLTTEFIVRLLDKETAEQLDAAMQSGKWKNRNACVNECIKGYLTYLRQKTNPEATLKELFEKHMAQYDWKIKKQLDDLKRLLLIISASQLFDGKALGYLINQFDNALNGQAMIAPLPDEAVKFGTYDQLPERFEKGKEAAIKELLEEE